MTRQQLTAQELDAIRRFAESAHEGQTYDDEGFFHAHVLLVANATLEFLVEPYDLVLAAAYLHDVVEDTHFDIDAIRDMFGDEVADVVWALTDSTEGENRAERKANTYTKTAANRVAVGVKLCDRITNVRASVVAAESGSGKNFLGMYRKEHEQFREMLHEPGEYDALWNELDRLLEEQT